MRKIRLDIEKLAVESFDTGDDDGRKGTVHGHASQYVACSQGSNCQTCQVGGCVQNTLTCFASCAQTTGTYDPETECFNDASRLQPCINPYC